MNFFQKKLALLGAILFTLIVTTGVFTAFAQSRITLPPAPVSNGVVRTIAEPTVRFDQGGAPANTNRPTTDPGTFPLPTPRFSAVNAPYWFSEPIASPVQILNDLIIHGLVDVRQGFVGNGRVFETRNRPFPLPSTRLRISVAPTTPPSRTIAPGDRNVPVLTLDITADMETDVRDFSLRAFRLVNGTLTPFTSNEIAGARLVLEDGRTIEMVQPTNGVDDGLFNISYIEPARRPIFLVGPDRSPRRITFNIDLRNTVTEGPLAFALYLQSVRGPGTPIDDSSLYAIPAGELGFIIHDHAEALTEEKLERVVFTPPLTRINRGTNEVIRLLPGNTMTVAIPVTQVVEPAPPPSRNVVDFSVDTLVRTPATPTVALRTPMTFSGIVRNSGNAASTASNVTLQMYTPGPTGAFDTLQTEFRSSLRPLVPGATETVRFPDASRGWTAQIGGLNATTWFPIIPERFRFRICADTSPNIVTESNENNNCTMSDEFTVPPAAEPVLAPLLFITPDPTFATPTLQSMARNVDVARLNLQAQNGDFRLEAIRFESKSLIAQYVGWSSTSGSYNGSAIQRLYLYDGNTLVAGGTWNGISLIFNPTTNPNGVLTVPRNTTKTLTLKADIKPITRYVRRIAPTSYPANWCLNDVNNNNRYDRGELIWIDRILPFTCDGDAQGRVIISTVTSDPNGNKPAIKRLNGTNEFVELLSGSETSIALTGRQLNISTVRPDMSSIGYYDVDTDQRFTASDGIQEPLVTSRFSGDITAQPSSNYELISHGAYMVQWTLGGVNVVPHGPVLVGMYYDGGADNVVDFRATSGTTTLAEPTSAQQLPPEQRIPTGLSLRLFAESAAQMLNRRGFVGLVDNVFRPAEALITFTRETVGESNVISSNSGLPYVVYNVRAQANQGQQANLSRFEFRLPGVASNQLTNVNWSIQKVVGNGAPQELDTASIMRTTLNGAQALRVTLPPGEVITSNPVNYRLVAQPSGCPATAIPNFDVQIRDPYYIRVASTNPVVEKVLNEPTTSKSMPLCPIILGLTRVDTAPRTIATPNSVQTLLNFNAQATQGNITISSLTLRRTPGSTATPLTNVTLKQGTTTIAGPVNPSGTNPVTFSLNRVIFGGTSQNFTVEANVACGANERVDLTIANGTDVTSNATIVAINPALFSEALKTLAPCPVAPTPPAPAPSGISNWAVPPCGSYLNCDANSGDVQRMLDLWCEEGPGTSPITGGPAGDICRPRCSGVPLDWCGRRNQGGNADTRHCEVRNGACVTRPDYEAYVPKNIANVGETAKASLFDIPTAQAQPIVLTVPTTIYDNVLIAGNGGAEPGNLTTNGSLISQGVNILQAATVGPLTVTGPVTIGSGQLSGELRVLTGALRAENLTVTSLSTPQLMVNGNLSAAGFGRFYSRQGTSVETTDSTGATSSVACDTGDVMMACMANISPAATGLFEWTTQNSTSCDVTVRVTDNSSVQFNAQASCFSPNG